MGLDHSPNIVTDGLVFIIDSANTRSYSGSGNTIYDLRSGTACTFWGGSGFSSSNAGMFYHNGSNAIRIEDSSILRPAVLTIASWCRFNTFDAFDTIVSKAQNGPSWGPPYLSYMIRIESNGTSINYALGDGSYRSSTYSYSFATNTHYHLVMTYDGATLKGYINGINVISTPLVITISYAALPVLISGSYGSVPFGETINGNISEVQFYNRALSAQEIVQNYNATKRRYGL